ncbi:RNA-metabolising metallo-beta-lactamase [Pyrococcus kukulkanii]|uniref:RNA-metabolising metallo-beta-lactamase n=2 Tax=Pyrococcus kukulkanii TaxID=1609559 RepID=A0A127BCC0_9EURY|nr:RNA-metabolising metallo-beta-lactamase [Pyrococcus kukulkanii]
MKITIYDGADTIGGTKIHVEDGRNGVFLDFGMNFAKYSIYYEEFLRERSARGIYDIWMLNLIPKLNIYRADLIPQDLSEIVRRYPAPRVDAVLISHAHLDHVGNIALLRENIPIVASPTTLVILKALRDTSQNSHMGMELPYYSPKTPVNGNPNVLKSDRKGDYIARDMVVTEKLKHDIERFMRWRPELKLARSNRVRKIRVGQIVSVEEWDFPWEVKAYPVDHSIYGAVGYVIDGVIAYTGDFRLHGERRALTKKFIKEAKNASVLITEGTRINREDFNVSEDEVYENALGIVEEANGLVVADFSPRNFERLETFKKIAKKTGRELVITSKDAYFLHALTLAEGVNYLEGVRIYENLKADPRKWELWVFERYGELKVTPGEIRESPENYILCFSFYDMPHLLDVMPSGGVYIYSSSEAFTEEQVFSFLRLWNWLQHFGFEVYGFKVLRDGRPVFEKGLHASGHASREDLIRVIDKVDPDYIIPVHTENPEWFKGAFGSERVVILNNGESFEI